MARGKPHSEELRAAAVAQFLAGASPLAVAAALNLPTRTAYDWYNELSVEEAALCTLVREERRANLLDGYLAANLNALTVQAGVAADENYLKRFPPQQLAILHGVMADKAARIVEVFLRTDSGLAGREGDTATGERDSAAGEVEADGEQGQEIGGGATFGVAYDDPPFTETAPRAGGD
jgi:hypothetical protein